GRLRRGHLRLRPSRRTWCRRAGLARGAEARTPGPDLSQNASAGLQLESSPFSPSVFGTQTDLVGKYAFVVAKDGEGKMRGRRVLRWPLSPNVGPPTSRTVVNPRSSVSVASAPATRFKCRGPRSTRTVVSGGRASRARITLPSGLKPTSVSAGVMAAKLDALAKRIEALQRDELVDFKPVDRNGNDKD